MKEKQTNLLSPDLYFVFLRVKRMRDGAGQVKRKAEEKKQRKETKNGRQVNCEKYIKYL